MNGANERQRMSLASGVPPASGPPSPRLRRGESEGRSPSDSEAAWGRSESFDPDNVGDIADEGIGHRG
jgi:hypothetical protein